MQRIQHMKRTDITDHSRAAFYLKARGHGLAPAAALIRAARLKAERDSALAASLAAHDALRALFESLGKIEPKRFSPEGQALQTARDAARVASENVARKAGYVPPSGRPYAGTWQPSKPGFYYCENPDSLFRDYDKAEGGSAWFDNPHSESARDGSGLVWGCVAQLPGRDGQARYIAGYVFGSCCPANPVFDLGTIHSDTDHESARKEAARAADSMAEAAAEAERDYQEAWQAGSQWADLGETIAQARTACLALLAERRAAMAPVQEIPAICRALRGSVTAWRQEIADARAERAALASGLWWSRHDESPLVAFAEGAGLDLATARGLCS